MKQINTIKGLENVRDYYYITTCGKVIGKSCILKPYIASGYEYVGLHTVNNECKKISIHRLVALAFIPNTENKAEVNHIDEVKIHNYVGNLEWCTSKDNMNWGTRNQRASESMKGEKNPNAKPMEYYEENSVTRLGFKRVCKTRKINFDNFIEIDSGERTKYRAKKYYYKIKKDVIKCQEQ